MLPQSLGPRTTWEHVAADIKKRKLLSKYPVSRLIAYDNDTEQTRTDELIKQTLGMGEFQVEEEHLFSLSIHMYINFKYRPHHLQDTGR